MYRVAIRPLALFTLPFVFLFLGPAFGPTARAQTPVFGPERYVRETGKPAKILKTFSAPDTTEPFVLTVVSGEGEEGPVTSAVSPAV